VVLNTELLKISVTDEDPEQASAIANFVAQEVIERVQSSDVIFNNSALTRGALRISVVESATPPDSPSGPNRSLFIVTGLLVGMLGGTALAFLFENLDTRIFKADEIERMARVPILGRIPLARNLGRVMFMFVIYPYVEAFRQLRTNTLAAMRSHSFRTLLVVSAEPEEGKSTIALNLACSIALTGKRVALIDADMRRPTLHTILKIDQPMGLSDVLRGTVSLENALVTTTFGQLDFLPAGANSPNPAELLETYLLAQMMETTEKNYDVVIIDTPALLAVADALILAEYADAVMLVVKRGSTTANAIQDALKQLEKLRAKPIGVVMNNAARENYPTYQKSIRSKKRGLQGLLTRKRPKSRNGFDIGDEDDTIATRPVEIDVVGRD
jgi:capsular exopolysaccharide synthesis family protein